MIRALIADDESLARRGLIARLASFDDIEVIAEAADGVRTCREILRLRPDVVFLDIEMPLLVGTEVARSLDSADAPEIIFISAYPEFAVDAFEIRALDYLLKPVTSARLGSAVERLREKLAPGSGNLPYKETLKIRDGDNTKLLPISDIDYISAAGDYMVITAGDQTEIYRTTLSSLADVLTPAGIVRIHRSTLLAPSRVACLERGANGDGYVVLHDGTRLRYSRSFRDGLRTALRLDE